MTLLLLIGGSPEWTLLDLRPVVTVRPARERKERTDFGPHLFFEKEGTPHSHPQKSMTGASTGLVLEGHMENILIQSQSFSDLSHVASQSGTWAQYKHEAASKWISRLQDKDSARWKET